jgi:5-methylcytosine-specific restriction endonuclease McrA
MSNIAKIIRPRGSKNPNWKGGITERNKALRADWRYFEWRKAVFERDGHTCRDCGDARGGNLNAHHIKAFAFYPELRFEVANGITLREPCHRKRHFNPNSTRNRKRLWPKQLQ